MRDFSKKTQAKIKRWVFDVSIILLFALLATAGILAVIQNKRFTTEKEASNLTELGGPADEVIDPTVPVETSTNSVAAPIKKGYLYAPVLMYHHIAKMTPQDSYYVSPETLTLQMQWLKDNGYAVISLDDLLLGMNNKKTLPAKPVVLTFDDGDRDHYANAFPILKKFGFTATFYVRLDRIGLGKSISWPELKEMQAAGMTIGSHTVNHKQLGTIDENMAIDEINLSKKMLENNLGVTIKHFSYPGGSYNDNIIKDVVAAGYQSATTTRHAVFHKYGSSPYLISRIHIDDEMPSFVDWIQGNNLK